MSGGEDWIMRPVVRGLCKYESLIGCVIFLEDLARMNEALDVLDENEYRMKEAADV